MSNFKVACPCCHWHGDVDHCDVGGADEDCVFCPRCGAEFSLHDSDHLVRLEEGTP